MSQLSNQNISSNSLNLSENTVPGIVHLRESRENLGESQVIITPDDYSRSESFRRKTVEELRKIHEFNNLYDLEALPLIEKLKLPIAQLNLPYRVDNMLVEAGIHCLKDLLNQSINSLKQIPGIGEKTIEDIFQRLEMLGFKR